MMIDEVDVCAQKVRQQSSRAFTLGFLPSITLSGGGLCRCPIPGGRAHRQLTLTVCLLSHFP